MEIKGEEITAVRKKDEVEEKLLKVQSRGREKQVEEMYRKEGETEKKRQRK
jgi:hypothetical protein